jgi:uncharacterized protein YfaS (alpha-2-macroglobulin family)
MTINRILGPALFLFCAAAAACAQTGELSVVVAAPMGNLPTIDQSQAIFVSFNQPMVPLAGVSALDGSQVMKIEPSIPGKYRWMGSTTLAFIPATRLPYGTSFVVTVTEGTTSLSGLHLQRPSQWTFTTPRPAVTGTQPGNGLKFVELDHSILLWFNQPVDPQAAAKFISLQMTVGSTTTYPGFSVVHPTSHEAKGDSTAALLLRPLSPFERSASIIVVCKAGLPGVEGSLGLASDFQVGFSTYGFLEFVRIGSDNSFEPGSDISFFFSNPVSYAEVASHLWFDPAVKVDPGYLNDAYDASEVRLSFPLRAETAYRGVVKAGLKDRFGNQLKADAPFSFTTSASRPYVRMTTGPGVLEAYESHNIPVAFMNVDSVAVQMGKVVPDHIVELMHRLDFSSREHASFKEGILLNPASASEEAREFSHTKGWRIKSARNARTVKPLNLDAVLGKEGKGIVFLQLDNLFAKNPRYLKSIIQVTNIGITAKFSPSSNLIWATHLNDASPVPGAFVEIRDDSNHVVWKGHTDSLGLASAPGWATLEPAPKGKDEGPEGDEEEEGWRDTQPHQWVVVRDGDDVAFTSSTWNEGIEPWAFGVEGDWNPQPEKVEGILFTDRGLYQANEKVEIKGITRVRKGGNWIIARRSDLRLTVRNSRNEEVLSTTPKLSPFGSFSATLTLKPSAPLGTYSMSLEVRKGTARKPRWSVIAEEDFRVEAFRPAEFEVTGKTALKEYTIGDTVTSFLAARYLFGAPLKNEPVRWRVSLSPSSWTPAGFGDYFFGPLGWLTRYGRGPGYRLLSSEQGRLDEFGSLMVKTPLPVGEIQGTSSMLLEGDVTSPTRQVLSGRAAVLIHDGEFSIGIKPSTTFLQTDSTLTYDIVAVAHDSSLVAGRAITVKVVHRVWNSVRKAETGGRYSWESEEVDSTFDSTSVTTGISPEHGRFTPNRPGFYYIEAGGKDPRGNQIMSQAYFYVSGSGYVPWERSNDDRIELVADKGHYAPGEIAHVMVKSPFVSAPALVSFEREGILHHYATVLGGSAPQIDIPITSAMLPNVFISVVMLQGRSAPPSGTNEGDAGRPSFKAGYINLSVSPKEQELHIAIETPRPEFRPGDTVEVMVHVRDALAKGVHAEVTLSVADLGVLNLINYRLPNPFSRFYRERGLGVTTTETLMHLVEQREYGEKGEDEGGGGAEAKAESDYDAEGMRRDFRPSAYWNPSLMTDSDGVARVRFKLPDNLTAFEVMAVAQTKDSKFGYGDASFVVSKSILLQPSLPRFARVGDFFTAGVVILNHSTEERSVSLMASARGITMSGGERSDHVLKPGQAKEVLFSFVAETMGKAVLTFRAQSGNDGDGLQWTFPVTVPRLRETVSLSESATEEKTEEAIRPPDGVEPDIGDVELTMASTDMIGLSGGISYLFTYPYYCLEQRCSSILPIILAQDLVDAFHFEVLKGKDARQVVAKTLDELPMFQREDGGFSYWKNSPRTWSYVSSYAVLTMLQAKNHGYAIDRHSLDRGLQYLHRILSGELKMDEYSGQAKDCVRALALFDLALAGKPDFGYMTTLYNDRANSPLFAKALLLRALHTAGGDKAQQEELARDLSNHAKIAPASVHFEEPREDGLDLVYHSTARTTALVMQALIETQPENPLIPKAVRWLLDNQKAGRWRTTQENLYVVDALATYFSRYEKVEPEFRAAIAMGGTELLRETFHGRSMTTANAKIPLSAITRGTDSKIAVTKEGPGRLYYGIRMNYYPRGPSVAKEEGLFVGKTVEVQGVPLEAGKPMTVGSIAKVTLTVMTNQERNFIVVDDAVPAGCEVITTSFNTTASNLEEERKESSWAFDHVEKYDDHVLLFADVLPVGMNTFSYLVRVVRGGTFILPSTRAEGMYEPEVFGQTASSVVEIK